MAVIDILLARYRHRNEPTASQTTAATTPVSAPRRNCPPPLYVAGLSIKELITILHDQIKKSGFFIRQTDADDLTDFVFGMDNFATAKKCLAKKNVQFYTFTPKNEKPKNVALKGIRGNYSAAEVQTELLNLAIQDVKICKVKKVSFNKMSSDTSFFTIQLPAESNKTALTKKKYILIRKCDEKNCRNRTTTDVPTVSLVPTALSSTTAAAARKHTQRTNAKFLRALPTKNPLLR